MINRGIQTTVLALAFLLCIQLTSLAVSVTGTLISAAWARENQYESAADSETNLLLYEYLRLSANNLGSSKL